MNDMLKDLIEKCNKVNASIMIFKVNADVGGEILPMAIIEDNEGRLSTLYYYDGWR